MTFCRPALSSLIPLLLLLGLAPHHVSGERMFCGRYLASPGDSKLEILEKCGEPALREVVSGHHQTRLEQWLYQPGQGRFPRLLTFEGMRLIKVETLTD